MVPQMKKFFARLLNSLKPCAGLVHAPRLKSPLPVHEIKGRNPAPASGKLVSRGSVALSRFPIVTETELSERKERILHYDFNSFK